MPRSALAAQAVTSAGNSPTFDAAVNVDGYSYRLLPGRVLEIKNTHTAAQNVEIPTPGTVDGLAVPERTVSVPATNGHVRIALGTNPAYRQSGGVAHVNFPGGVTGLSVALVDNP
jgi:hypothetical protein